MSDIRLPEQNTVLLTGRLTRDAELKYTAAGVAVCHFSLAVNRNYKDPKSGEWKDDTSYVDINVWREAAERCGQVLKKGSLVDIERLLKSSLFEGQDGTKRTKLEVEARRVQILEKPVASEAPSVGADIEEVPF